MPYQTMEEVNPAIRGIKPPVSLEQANMIAAWADRLEQEGKVDNPWAVAISQFKKSHHVEGNKWVKNESSEAEHGVPAFVVDLMSDVPHDSVGRPDFSKPFRILPAGPIHRFGQSRLVTPDDIDMFADNWLARETRGIRRKKVVIDVEHESGGVGQYNDIHSRREDGLWATIGLSPKGEKLLAERDFHYFSPTVAWSFQDSITGEPIRNQVVGGALTNYPVFGEQTALPTLGYSDRALCSLWQGGLQIAGYATKTESGTEYPASAYIIVEDPEHPTTWHLRYKEYVNGELVVTKKQLGAASSALSPGGHRGQRVQLTPEQEKTAKRKLLAEYRKLDTPDEEIPPHLFSQKGDNTMSEFDQNERDLLKQIAGFVTTFGGLLKKGESGQPTVDVAAFATLKDQLSTLQTKVEALGQERDTLKTQVQAGEQKLQGEVYARQLVEMKAQVQKYSRLALPVELPAGAPAGSMTSQEHFAWLYNTDTTQGKPHFEWFNSVLTAANKALAEAEVFTELGAGHSTETDPDLLLHQKAQAYAQAHKVDYVTALKAVAAGAQPGRAA